VARSPVIAHSTSSDPQPGRQAARDRRGAPGCVPAFPAFNIQNVPFRCVSDIASPITNTRADRRLRARLAATGHWSPSVTRLLARIRTDRRIGMPIEAIGICGFLCADCPFGAGWRGGWRAPAAGWSPRGGGMATRRSGADRSSGVLPLAGEAVQEQPGQCVDCFLVAEWSADRFPAASDPYLAEALEQGVEGRCEHRGIAGQGSVKPNTLISQSIAAPASSYNRWGTTWGPRHAPA
jgi:hypothetical protein